MTVWLLVWIVWLCWPGYQALKLLVIDFLLRLTTFDNSLCAILHSYFSTYHEHKIRKLNSRQVARAQPHHIQLDQRDRVLSMCTFARFIYYTCWLFPKRWIARIMGVKSEDLFMTPLEDDGIRCPKFLILIHHDTKSVVLVVRGTFSLNDILIDLTAYDKKFWQGSNAHAGMLDGAQKILRLARDQLNQLLFDNPQYDLVITGHSLGAGTAILITLALLFEDVPDHLNFKNRIFCFAFAPPPVFRSDAPLPDSILEKILIFILETDLVPSACVGSVDKLIRDFKAADFRLSNGDFASDLIELPEALPPLKHPGRVLYIHHDGQEFNLYHSDGDLFSDDLVLDWKMLWHHFGFNYLTAIKSLR